MAAKIEVTVCSCHNLIYKFTLSLDFKAREKWKAKMRCPVATCNTSKYIHSVQSNIQTKENISFNIQGFIWLHKNLQYILQDLNESKLDFILVEMALYINNLLLAVAPQLATNRSLFTTE